ncbi:MAG TPA: TetR/AcrR family transcriptional regulator [Nevskiaceae bacterium]|nr:TetR/AcrR family transcriptional regulator [Nevskiaceae bacterium]
MARGRPKDLDKRSAVLQAAKGLFARGGLAGTSMEAIARAAGVSKLTLYSHFANKDELFRQCVTAKCEEHTPVDLFDLRPGRPLRQRLEAIAEAFLGLVTSPEAVDLYRLMVADGGSSKLSRLFWEAGPARSKRQLAELLAAAAAAGELEIDDADSAAAQFFSLVKGELHMKLMVGVLQQASPEMRRQQALLATDWFLRACQPRRRR